METTIFFFQADDSIGHNYNAISNAISLVPLLQGFVILQVGLHDKSGCNPYGLVHLSSALFSGQPQVPWFVEIMKTLTVISLCYVFDKNASKCWICVVLLQQLFQVSMCVEGMGQYCGETPLIIVENVLVTRLGMFAFKMFRAPEQRAICFVFAKVYTH